MKTVKTILFLMALVLLSCSQPKDTGEWVERNVRSIDHDFLINNGWVLLDRSMDEPHFKSYIYEFTKDTLPTELHLATTDSVIHVGVYFVNKNLEWTLRTWDNYVETTDSLIPR